MNFKIRILLVLFSLGLFISSVFASEDDIKQMLSHSMPGLKVDSIQTSPIPGLYEVIAGSNIFYASADGKYLLQGKLIDVKARKDLTEEKLAALRAKSIEKIGKDQMIIFQPEKTKYTISVFTDIDCGYCRKLHSEIDQYLDQGIAIQYLFFPRAGKGSSSYNKAISVWCAKDRKSALTEAKKGNDPESKTCDNPVDKHMKLAHELGARGTPMIVTEKGTVYPGYMPAKQLVQALQMEKN
jgi:thiol:disulfide interchange protein DsbC